MKIQRIALCCVCCAGLLNATAGEGVREIGRGFANIGSGVWRVVKAPFTGGEQQQQAQNQQQNGQQQGSGQQQQDKGQQNQNGGQQGGNQQQGDAQKNGA